MQRQIDRFNMKQPIETGIGFTKMSMRVRTIVSLLSALILAACVSPVLAQEISGKNLGVFYQQNCSRCHGSDGSASSADGGKLRGQDFTDPKWQRDTRDDEMVGTILKGKFFGLAMPSFKGTLTADEAQRMVTDIIRKSKKGHVIAADSEMPVGK